MAIQINRTQNSVRNVLIPNSLTHSSGIITAIFSGKSYQVILGTLAANARYQLYIVPGGNLIYSTNENSVGPTGYTSWFLVGSFYSTDQTVPVFGSFIRDLFSTPETEAYFWNATVTGLGTGSGSYTYRTIKRSGSDLILNLRFDKDGSAGTGAATVTFAQPTNTTVGGTPVVGTGISNINSNNWSIATNNSGIYFYNGGGIFVGSQFTGGQFIIGTLIYPVVGWDNTPIAYL